MAAEITIAFLGCSLTAGDMLDSPQTQAFPFVLAELLGQNHMHVTILRSLRSGSLVTSLKPFVNKMTILERAYFSRWERTHPGMAALDRIDTEVIEPCPDVAIILLGQPDSFQRIIPIDIFQSGLESVITKIRKEEIRTIVLSVPWLPPPFYSKRFLKMYSIWGHASAEKTANYADAVRAAATNCTAEYIDLYGATRGKETYFQPDGAHLTLEGHRAVATLLYDHLVSNSLSFSDP